MKWVVNLYYLGHQIKSLLGDGAAYGPKGCLF